MRWYSMFTNNKFVKKGKHTEGSSEILIKNLETFKICAIKIQNKITFNYNKESKYTCEKDNLNIYFVDYKLIEIIKINDEKIYRTKIDLSKNSIIDTLGDHLFLIAQLKNEENNYTRLLKISKNKFINEINNILKQKIEINNCIELIEYKYINFDEKYSIYSNDIKQLFYEMYFTDVDVYNIDYYDLSKNLSELSNKNKKVFDKFMEWYEENRDKSNDHVKILVGKDKGKKIIDFNLKELKKYIKTNPIIKKDILLSQNKAEITTIFFETINEVKMELINYEKPKNIPTLKQSNHKEIKMGLINYEKPKNIPTLKQSNHKEGWVQDLPCYSCGIKCYAPIWNKTYYALCKMCFNGCPDIDDKKLKNLLGFSKLPDYKEKVNKTELNLEFID